MKRKELRDLLSRHVDALVQDEGLTHGLPFDYDQNDDQIESLLSLATTLKQVLVPVVNEPPYKRYWASLTENSASEVIIRQSKKIPPVWILIAIIGSLLSFMSVALVLLRRVRLSTKHRSRHTVSAV